MIQLFSDHYTVLFHITLSSDCQNCPFQDNSLRWSLKCYFLDNSLRQLQKLYFSGQCSSATTKLSCPRYCSPALPKLSFSGPRYFHPLYELADLFSVLCTVAIFLFMVFFLNKKKLLIQFYASFVLFVVVLRHSFGTSTSFWVNVDGKCC